MNDFFSAYYTAIPYRVDAVISLISLIFKKQLYSFWTKFGTF